MFFGFAQRDDKPPRQPTCSVWRWRFVDPRTGELVNPSEPLTAEQVRAINPCAEVIPGSRMQLSRPVNHPA